MASKQSLAPHVRLFLFAATACAVALACGGVHDRTVTSPPTPLSGKVAPTDPVVADASNPSASFLDAPPVIDGVPDPSTRALPSYPLALMTGQPRTGERPPSFRIGYTARYLY